MITKNILGFNSSQFNDRANDKLKRCHVFQNFATCSQMDITSKFTTLLVPFMPKRLSGKFIFWNKIKHSNANFYFTLAATTILIVTSHVFQNIEAPLLKHFYSSTLFKVTTTIGVYAQGCASMTCKWLFPPFCCCPIFVILVLETWMYT